MNPMSGRRAFTVVELLVATAVMVSMIALVYTVWQSTFSTINRSRAVVALDLRARAVADLVQETIDNRSGCMPMAMQNEIYSRAWFHRIYAFQGNRHVGGRVERLSTMTAKPPFPNQTTWTVRWVREKTGNYTWKFAGPLAAPSPDAFSPDKNVIEGTRDLTSIRWGLGRTAIWLGGAMPFDGNMSYLRGGAVSTADRRWTMLGSSTGTYGPGLPWNGNRDIPANTMNSAISGGRYLPLLTSATRTSGAISGHNPLGPYRGVSITPWAPDQKSTAGAWNWLGETHVLRIINGPTFPGEPNSRGDERWSPLRTEATTGSGFLEPDWFLGTPPNGPQGPRPAYGTIIDDGAIRWRVEGNTLFSAGPNPFPDTRLSGSVLLHSGPNSVDVPNGRGSSYVGMINPSWINGHATRVWMDRTPYVPTVERFVGDGASGQPHSAHLASGSVMSLVHTRNLSQLTVEPTSRWSAIPVQGRGRFGSLTIGARARGLTGTNLTNSNGTIYDWGGMQSPSNPANFTINGIVSETEGGAALAGSQPSANLPAHHIAGFQGSTPTGMDQPGHPPVLMLTIGLVGGFSSTVEADPIDRRPRNDQGVPSGTFVNPSAIERRWTVGGVIR